MFLDCTAHLVLQRWCRQQFSLLLFQELSDMHRASDQHQAPVLPELPALWIWFHGGREPQSVAHWDQRSSCLCTVSATVESPQLISCITHCTEFSFSISAMKTGEWSSHHVSCFLHKEVTMSVKAHEILCRDTYNDKYDFLDDGSYLKTKWSLYLFFSERISMWELTMDWGNSVDALCLLPPLQETLPRALSRHRGRGHFQRLPPKQRRWIFICLIFTVFLLPILHVHHQLLLLSQTESTTPHRPLHTTVSVHKQGSTWGTDFTWPFTRLFSQKSLTTALLLHHMWGLEKNEQNPRALWGGFQMRTDTLVPPFPSQQGLKDAEMFQLRL